jgi:hypothetical protein
MASWEPCALCRMGGHRECCICCNDAIAAEYRREQLELERIEAQRRIREQESLEEERKRRAYAKKKCRGAIPYGPYCWRSLACSASSRQSVCSVRHTNRTTTSTGTSSQPLCSCLRRCTSRGGTQGEVDGERGRATTSGTNRTRTTPRTRAGAASDAYKHAVFRFHAQASTLADTIELLVGTRIGSEAQRGERFRFVRQKQSRARRSVSDPISLMSCVTAQRR